MINNKQIYFYSGLIILISGIFVYWIGLHNIDNSQNILRMQEDMNLYLAKNNIDKQFYYIETTNIKTNWELLDCYKTGLDLNVLGFFISLAGCFILSKSLEKN